MQSPVLWSVPPKMPKNSKAKAKAKATTNKRYAVTSNYCVQFYNFLNTTARHGSIHRVLITIIRFVRRVILPCPPFSYNRAPPQELPNTDTRTIPHFCSSRQTKTFNGTGTGMVQVEVEDGAVNVFDSFFSRPSSCHAAASDRVM